MRAFAVSLALAAVLAGSAQAQWLGAAPAAGIPSYEVPNTPGTVTFPFVLSSPPMVPEQRSYEQLLDLWHRAGAAYGVPWQVLGAINKIESNLGGNMGPSSAGAVGWMQFLPSTWERWGMDASGDGLADPWNPEDAVFAAARYLAAAGAHEDLYRGIYAYNHADWYVQDVLELAAAVGGGTLDVPLPLTGGETVIGFTPDDLEERLAQARRDVARANGAALAAEDEVEQVGWMLLDAEQRAGDPDLTDEEFLALQAEVELLQNAEEEARGRAERLGGTLAKAAELFELLRSHAGAVSFTRPISNLAGPNFAGGYVFPVGGGPGVVSVGHDHHDYPAADIAAPEGSPLYALANGVVVDAYPAPQGLCGIGFTIQVESGATYTYCHLSYLEPSVAPGVAFAAGAPVGLVGSTGHSTGPHLHLQLVPSVAYPQDEPWFQAFAGTAFSWQDEPRLDSPERTLATAGAAEQVFTVVDDAVITFTR